MAEQETSTSDKNDAGRWHVELGIAERELRKFWEQGRRVIKRYMVENDSASLEGQQSKYNIYWSNVGVLRASLYANPPKPLVKRTFNDFMDDGARVAALMMERLLQQGFHRPESDMQVAFCQTVDDRLIPGLGQIWLRYCPEIQNEEIVDEHVLTDYLYWEDFLWSPARTWEEVWWVARRAWLSRAEFKVRFDEEKAKLVAWTKKPGNKGDRVTPENMGRDRTEVFEIWNKSTRKVCWVSKSCEEYLDEQDDPLELDNFFPCPKPLLATHTTSSLVPKADYIMVQTQYRRLDNLELRIGLLQDAIRAAGVYDKANNELSQLLGTSPANAMIPVDNFGMFAEKGGLKGSVDWFPIDLVVAALDKLREVFNDEKMKLYELTGISDIMRGTTSPRETYGAQRLKAQYSSVRLQYMQNEVAYFIQSGLRIKAEIISKHFQPESIVKNSLIEHTPDKDLALEAVQILKNEWASCYRIEVHADTLAIPDFQAEQSARVEFIGAVGQFLGQSVQMIQMIPEAGPYLVRILQWGIASFRSAQSIEGVFDKAARMLEEKAKQPPQAPQPDPQLITAQAKAQKTQSDIKVQEVGLQLEVQAAAGEAGKAQQEIAALQQKTQAELAADQMRLRAELEQENARLTADLRATQLKTLASVHSINAKTQAQVIALRSKARATPKGESK